MKDPKAKLESANAAITTAAMLIAAEMATIDTFLEECQRMDSVGHILDPTLFMNSERRATAALLRPLYTAARDFNRIHQAQMRAAIDALVQVDG